VTTSNQTTIRAKNKEDFHKLNRPPSEPDIIKVSREWDLHKIQKQRERLLDNIQIHRPERELRAIRKRALRLLTTEPGKHRLSPAELLALGAAVLDYQTWLLDEAELVSLTRELVEKAVAELDTTPETINPLADGLGLSRHYLKQRLARVRLSRETDESGKRPRWRPDRVISYLLRRRWLPHNGHTTPIVFKTADGRPPA